MSRYIVVFRECSCLDFSDGVSTLPVPLSRILKTSFWAFVLSFVFTGFSNSAMADGIPPVTPEELKMTSEPLAPGAPAIILYRQVDRDDRGNTAHENDFVRIKILTEEGRKYADVEIPFVRSSGNNVVGIKARTIRPDGSMVNYDGKVYDKAIVKAKGVRYMAKTFTLPEVQVGSVIEYSYTTDLSEYTLYDSHWILSDDLFTKNAVFSLKPYTSDYFPINVRWSWQGLPAGTDPPKEG